MLLLLLVVLRVVLRPLVEPQEAPPLQIDVKGDTASGGKQYLCLGTDVAECPFQALNLCTGAAKLMAQLLFQHTHQLAAGLRKLII